MQDTVTITSKEAETRGPSHAVPNAAGILNTSNFLDPDYQKTPSASHPLAGKFARLNLILYQTQQLIA